MRSPAIPLSVAFGVASGAAHAQTVTAPPPRLAPDADTWMISETTSPVDYAPIVTATTVQRLDANGSSLQLSIHCRGGRTELLVGGMAVARSGENYTISYRINDAQSVQLAAVPSSFGVGAAFKGDVVRLLQSLPKQGGMAIRLSTREGATLDGYFSLGGLTAARDKIAAACRWPQAISAPPN